jgi:hypothetical protein
MSMPPDNAPPIVSPPASQLPLLTPAQQQLQKNPVTDLVMQSSPQQPQLTQTPYGSGTSPVLMGAGVPYGG